MGGVWPIADIFQTMEEGFRCGYPNFLFKKKKKKFYGVSAWKKGPRRAEAVRTRVEGVNFL